jgi:hypothetical protein
MLMALMQAAQEAAAAAAAQDDGGPAAAASAIAAADEPGFAGLVVHMLPITVLGVAAITATLLK